MGLLALGTPLEWPEAKKAASQVREWGIEQLLAIWNRAKGKENDSLLWGDEIEYLVVNFDDADRKVKLSLRQADILRALAEDEKLLKQGGGVPDINSGVSNSGKTAAKCAPTFHPEFGRFMLEATPGKPWGIKLTDLLEVEDDMKWRRIIAKEHMKADEFPITLTTFPRLGQKNTLSEELPSSGERLRSQFLPDEIANPHIRFPTLAANIRARRGKKVEINVPVFKDEKTPSPFSDPTVNYDLHQWPEDDDVRNGAAKQDHIYMDAMAFGMGSCCLQITFQAKNVEEGRKMYDQLSPLGPIMLALTAATPIYKGFLAETDVRWNQISRAVDDRTDEELGNKVRTIFLSLPSPSLTPTATPKRPLAHPQIPLRLQLHLHLPRRPTPPRIPRPRSHHRPRPKSQAHRRRHGRPPRHPLRPPLHPRPHCHLRRRPKTPRSHLRRPLRKPAIHKLATHALQASARHWRHRRPQHRLARRIPQHGDPDD